MKVLRTTGLKVTYFMFFCLKVAINILVFSCALAIFIVFIIC